MNRFGHVPYEECPICSRCHSVMTLFGLESTRRKCIKVSFVVLVGVEYSCHILSALIALGKKQSMTRMTESGRVSGTLWRLLGKKFYGEVN